MSLHCRPYITNTRNIPIIDFVVILTAMKDNLSCNIRKSMHDPRFLTETQTSTSQWQLDGQSEGQNFDIW